MWKYYFEKNVEHLVWSRCSEIQDALVETFMTQEIYPDPLHPVRALQALDEVLQAQRTGTDDACLDRIARKASKLVAELRQDGIYVRRPRPGEGPLSRIAEIFGYLDSNTCNMLGYKFRRYKALRRHGTFDGLYHWWDQEGRAEISSLLEAAHISRNLPVNLIKEGDEQAMSGR